MADRYTWPDSECLKNRLGLKDSNELVAAEARIVAVRNVQLLRSPLPGYYNLDHLKRFHRFLFQDVYNWAGETRVVDISKSGVPFAHWRNVDEEVSALLAKLDDDAYLHGRTEDSFVERLAFYYGELNARHPFREGNGRTQRTFLRQLSVGAGWRLDWSQLSQIENVEASRRNLVSADHQELAELLRPLVTRI